MNLLLLFLGAMLLLAFNLNKAYPRRDFSWAIFVRKNLFSTIVNLIVGVILILSKDDLSTIFPVTKLSIAMVGFAGGALWKYIFDIISPTKKTAVGLSAK